MSEGPVGRPAIMLFVLGTGLSFCWLGTPAGVGEPMISLANFSEKFRSGSGVPRQGQLYHKYIDNLCRHDQSCNAILSVGLPADVGVSECRGYVMLTPTHEAVRIEGPALR